MWSTTYTNFIRLNGNHSWFQLKQFQKCKTLLLDTLNRVLRIITIRYLSLIVGTMYCVLQCCSDVHAMMCWNILKWNIVKWLSLSIVIMSTLCSFVDVSVWQIVLSIYLVIIFIILLMLFQLLFICKLFNWLLVFEMFVLCLWTVDMLQ